MALWRRRFGQSGPTRDGYRPLGTGSKTVLSKRVFSYGGRLGYEDAGDTPNTLVVMHEYPDDGKTLVFEVRGLKTDGLKGAKVGVIFYGSEGYVVLTSYTTGAAFDLKGKRCEKIHRRRQSSSTTS